MHARKLAALAAAALLHLPAIGVGQTESSQPVRLASRAVGRTIEPAPAAPAADPYGFVQLMNQYRASAGLGPVAFDANLSAWASQNNAAQSRKGIGHHVNPNCYQNSAWNCTSAWDVAQSWMNSPGHRRNMLSPHITHVGIAYGPGPYWTMNAR